MGASQLSVSRPLATEGFNPSAGAGSYERAWRALLAARAAPGAAEGVCIDGGGRLGADSQGCLLVREASGWAVGPGATEPEVALVDLYLPVVNASAARPLTVAHLGQSLDGYIATDSGDSYYVTGPENVAHLHRMRALCGAIVVGAETISLDNPRLTVRRVAGPNPMRVILDPRRRLGPDFRVFSDADTPTLLISADDRCEPEVTRHGCAEIVRIPAPAGRLALDRLLAELHGRGVFTIFVEGGGATVSHFLQADLLDRLQIAVAPLVTGHGRPGIRLVARHHLSECLRPGHRLFRMGGDMLFDCDLRSPASDSDAESGLARVY
ncbi:MAG TPA: RibD family protein [Gammaproteobacteria bacterium]|nr:RibD family protein [Gammaproteobacteria bacterium]